MLPKQARYQLRYTPIVIKLWSCKWSNLWSNTQSHFLTAIFCFPYRPKIARLITTGRFRRNRRRYLVTAYGTDKRQKNAADTMPPKPSTFRFFPKPPRVTPVPLQTRIERCYYIIKTAFRQYQFTAKVRLLFYLNFSQTAPFFKRGFRPFCMLVYTDMLLFEFCFGITSETFSS